VRQLLFLSPTSIALSKSQWCSPGSVAGITAQVVALASPWGCNEYPPHNLGEVVDGLIALNDHPNLSDEKLWELIPGPDFPYRGGNCRNRGHSGGLQYRSGSIPCAGSRNSKKLLRGEGRRQQRRTAIVVTELPYQVNKAGWIEKVAELVNHGRMEGIADLRDESESLRDARGD
jgi:DNA gyrase subunit A